MSGPEPNLVAGLRRFKKEPSEPLEKSSNGAVGHKETTVCELCPVTLPDVHKHLLDLEERLIVCVCSTCWMMRSGDGRYRPTGSRTIWLDGFVLEDDVWADFKIPIGLAFFMRSSTTERVVALYPSPAGATECELDLDGWQRLVDANPVLADLDPDAEALLVNRMSLPHSHVIAPLDDAYRLVGVVKATWEGISGGSELEAAIERYFDELRAGAVVE